MFDKLLTLDEFHSRFATEEACIEYLVRTKWPNGFNCSRCYYHTAYQIKTRRLPLYECMRCGYQA